ncbi:MAG: hypothetical protein PHQ42_05160, partial [Patescibacteria group bacterium]|nr:hypothetical protein [Patescibacteria group bacterium]
RSNNSLRFWRGSNRMIITADGKVGIGTDNPYANLHINGGNLYVTDNGNNPFILVGDSQAGGEFGFLKWDSANDKLYLGTSAGGNSITINENGNVGIGVTNPQAKLDVAGDIAVNGRPYLKVGSVNARAGSTYDKAGKDVLDLKSVVGSLENAKKCLVFVVASKAEHGYDYKTSCRVDNNGFIDAKLEQDGIGPYDGMVTCGYICSATTDQDVVYY